MVFISMSQKHNYLLFPLVSLDGESYENLTILNNVNKIKKTACGNKIIFGICF